MSGNSISNVSDPDSDDDAVNLGYVIDFLDFRIWPVFNLADSLVSAGVVGLVFSYVRK